MFVSFLFNEIILFSSFFFLFFSTIKGELEGVYWDNLEPLVDGSISSFELSGIIIFKLFFFSWECSILSSIASSFISFISFILGDIIFIVFAGFKSFGWSFCNNFGWTRFWFWSGEKSSKKSFGNIFLLIVLILDKLLIC